MKLFIGADHRGYKLKNTLIDWLKKEGYDVVDCGNTKYDPDDDYPDFAHKVALKVSQYDKIYKNTMGGRARGAPLRAQSIVNDVRALDGAVRGQAPSQSLIKPVFGIVLCGSGVGVSIAANRHHGAYCALGFDEHQVKHVRENDHVNMLSLPNDYLTLDKMKKLITIFINTKPIYKEKYLRRLKKLDK